MAFFRILPPRPTPLRIICPPTAALARCLAAGDFVRVTREVNIRTQPGGMLLHEGITLKTGDLLYVGGKYAWRIGTADKPGERLPLLTKKGWLASLRASGTVALPATYTLQMRFPHLANHMKGAVLRHMKDALHKL